MSESLGGWRKAFEEAGFDVLDDDGAIVGRRQRGSAVETVAVDLANRVLLTVTAPIGVPVTWTEQVLGCPASVVEEMSRTLVIRIAAIGGDPGQILEALLALAQPEPTR